jgi:chromosome segregation ATPase
MNDPITRHIELLHAYHLDLWTEVEAQLRVIRGAQEQIAKLREAREAGESIEQAHHAAEILARHVQTLKGRIHALEGTVNELDATVGELLKVLAP